METDPKDIVENIAHWQIVLRPSNRELYKVVNVLPVSKEPFVWNEDFTGAADATRPSRPIEEGLIEAWVVGIAIPHAGNYTSKPKAPKLPKGAKASADAIVKQIPEPPVWFHVIRPKGLPRYQKAMFVLFDQAQQPRIYKDLAFWYNEWRTYDERKVSQAGYWFDKLMLHEEKEDERSLKPKTRELFAPIPSVSAIAMNLHDGIDQLKLEDFYRHADTTNSQAGLKEALKSFFNGYRDYLTHLNLHADFRPLALDFADPKIRISREVISNASQDHVLAFAEFIYNNADLDTAEFGEWLLIADAREFLKAQGISFSTKHLMLIRRWIITNPVQLNQINALLRLAALDVEWPLAEYHDKLTRLVEHIDIVRADNSEDVESKFDNADQLSFSHTLRYIFGQSKNQQKTSKNAQEEMLKSMGGRTHSKDLTDIMVSLASCQDQASATELVHELFLYIVKRHGVMVRQAYKHNDAMVKFTSAVTKDQQ